MSEQDLDQVQARADRAIAEVIGQLSGPAAVFAAAVLVHRAVVELHRQARSGATDTQGTEQWGAWAGLRNLARNLVLQASSARDAAAALAGRGR